MDSYSRPGWVVAWALVPKELVGSASITWGVLPVENLSTVGKSQRRKANDRNNSR